jgi:hypothetical protein
VVRSSDAPGLWTPLHLIIFLILELSFWPGLFALPSKFEGQVGASGHWPSFCLDAVIVLVSSFNSFRPLMEALFASGQGGDLGPVQGFSFRFLLDVRLRS